jgi:hypothetical protein
MFANNLVEFFPGNVTLLLLEGAPLDPTLAD